MAHVLVVDDSTVDRKLAGGLLESVDGWSVAYAEDGMAAVELLKLATPDVIVTDLQMPEMDGLALVQHCQVNHPLIPVILMTGKGSEEIAQEALQQGAASYVPKGQLAEMLVATVHQLTSLAGEKRSRKSLMTTLASVTYEFQLGNDPVVLTALVAHIQGIVADLGILNESERLRTGVALEEALLNAAYHGNLEVSSQLREEDHSAFYELARQRSQTDPYAQRRIFVKVTISREGLEYHIRDEGPGFDPNKLPDPTDPTNLERPCGRGVLLMRTFMDSVEYNDQGNQVTLQKSATQNVLHS